MHGEPVGHEHPYFCNESNCVHVESNAKDRFGFDDASVRAGFVRKVFAIVSVMFLVVVVMTTPVIADADVRLWMITNSWIQLLALLVFMGTMITLMCCQSLARNFPINLVLLGVFTVSAGLISMVACARVPPATVLLALVTTTLSCSAIILFASQTSFDVTRHMFIIFAAGTAVAIFGVVLMILSLFVYIKVLHTVFTALVCVSFMAYLAVDIQMIVGGRRYNLSPEEYVFASLLLFIDIYEIFLTLLSLFNRE